MAKQCKYSCDSAAETLEWIKAIADFIKPYSFLINAHVVNFFKDRLWESVDKEWIECLGKESVENLLLIPSGVVQDHWPTSLKEFVLTLKSLVYPREQADLKKVFPDFHTTSLNSVLSQGMNLKKKHEVEVLSAIVSSIVSTVQADAIIDVGAGQGYLAQVLAFEYQHSVVAVDACSHHGNVTDARAERIKKHYTVQMRKFGSGNKRLNVPQTITCRIMSLETLKALSTLLPHKCDVEQPKLIEQDLEQYGSKGNRSSLVLAGLHACGDLSVTMLKTILECEEVRAVISIGCCYNLLSEEGFENARIHYGFPMSCGVKTISLSLGKSSRDLACQSAERWKSLGKEAGLHNFELHAFRAAFQMVLHKYFPEVIITSPSIGRQGKALRRKQQRRIMESELHDEESTYSSLPQSPNMDEACSVIQSGEAGAGDKSGIGLNLDALVNKMSLDTGSRCEGRTISADKYSLFEKFCRSGLCRLGLKPLVDINFLGIWNEVEPYVNLIGVYWSLRAAFGPLLETVILLDRLLFLQEQAGHLNVVMLPIFDPALSPRNVAIIAKKLDTVMAS
ncbi:protein RRNAD1 isoform X2 [Durio zibethinus]|uniref:Protein RRNAD1 isoform X2 n=1 Tax=Durio zibethinus TaxID=66656 RepID=A0A6P5WPT7_DURZI|nr:protein RRNAD1 isoform X2 [Durio zibethinus]